MSMAYLLERMDRAAKQNNSLLVVVYIPRLNRGNTPPPPPELIDSLSQDTVFIDLSGAVIQHYANPDNALLRFEQDGHPNDVAHELIAQKISQALRDKGVF